MSRLLQAAGATVLLGAPTVLAFFSGGYFDEPRLWAALVAWALVAGLAAAGRPVLPRAGAGSVALAGLAALGAWSALSLLWAPLAGPAFHHVQRLVLYLGVTLAAAGLLRRQRTARAVEPALATGIGVVIGYGLAGRLLPGVLHLATSATAAGRLEQPLTYWNGEGALAAVGLVLCARLAGDPGRRPGGRAVAAGACAPLGAALYLSYSRGAIAAAVAGLAVLVVAAPTRMQLRAALAAFAAGIVAAAATSAFPAVAAGTGALSERTSDGAAALAVLAATALLFALVSARGVSASGSGEELDRPLRLPRRARALTAGVVLLTAAGLIVGGLAERGAREAPAGARAARLASVSTNRYAYWGVGVRSFAAHPWNGLGAGGFRVAWARHRSIEAGVLEVHSLELEMAAELGLPGLVALAALLAGAGLAAIRALRRRPGLVAGWCAAATVLLLHATIDWDWEMPAVTLPALILAGGLLAQGDAEPVGAGVTRPPAPGD